MPSVSATAMDHAGRCRTGGEPGKSAEQRERERLSEELAPDGAARSTQRLANADLARALGHAHEHDVHDHDAANDNADDDDGRDDGKDHARELAPERDQSLYGMDSDLFVG